MQNKQTAICITGGGDLQPSFGENNQCPVRQINAIDML